MTHVFCRCTGCSVPMKQNYVDFMISMERAHEAAVKTEQDISVLCDDCTRNFNKWTANQTAPNTIS
jgi:hypothetical protein